MERDREAKDLAQVAAWVAKEWAQDKAEVAEAVELVEARAALAADLAEEAALPLAPEATACVPAAARRRHTSRACLVCR
ncbi:MAG: hypothetical protein JW759_09035 [Candidatus Coatesbacteria bacterium]|nr:hypothetical protein [Candidatus Coatesbacteria bacterium]